MRRAPGASPQRANYAGREPDDDSIHGRRHRKSDTFGGSENQEVARDHGIMTRKSVPPRGPLT
jgi:hypothetical protein